MTSFDVDNLPESGVEMLQREYDHEGKMSSAGSDRTMKRFLKAQQDGKEHRTEYGTALESLAIDAVVKELLIKKANSHIAYRTIKNLDPRLIAQIALQEIISGISKDVKLTSLAVKIGSRIEDEMRFKAFEAAAPALYRSIENDFDTNSTEVHKRRVFIIAIGRHDITVPTVEKQKKLHIGQHLLNVVQRATGFIVQEKHNVAYHRDNYLVHATDKLHEWLANRKSWLIGNATKFMPCLIKPREWSASRVGGYHFPVLMGELKLITKMPTKRFDGLIADPRVDLTNSYTAINALQNTSWKINNKVLDVVRYFWEETETELMGFPARNKPPKPSKPEDFNIDPFVKKAWKKEVEASYKDDRVRKNKSSALMSILSTAKTMAEHHEFYFPYHLDFRGRIYAVSEHLHPQANTLSKALLTFSEGIELGSQEAADWLAIHGANCFGKDKLLFKDRLQFIEEHEELILTSAYDPIHNRWWMKAAKTPMFLAFCFEWAAYKEEGLSFKSSLPIALDPTCNGIQHFAALGRDEATAEIVNLCNIDQRNDIYQTVADNLNRMLEEEVSNSSGILLKYF